MRGVASCIRRIVGWVVLVVAICAGDYAEAEQVDIVFNLIDEPGTGFLHPTLGASRLEPFERAAQIWESYLGASYPGETIHVE